MGYTYKKVIYWDNWERRVNASDRIKGTLEYFSNNKEVKFWLCDWILVTKNNKEISQNSLFYNVLLKGLSLSFLKATSFTKVTSSLCLEFVQAYHLFLLSSIKNVRRKITVSLTWFQSLHKSETSRIPNHKLLRIVYSSFTYNELLNSHFTKICLKLQNCCWRQIFIEISQLNA